MGRPSAERAQPTRRVAASKHFANFRECALKRTSVGKGLNRSRGGYRHRTTSIAARFLLSDRSLDPRSPASSPASGQNKSGSNAHWEPLEVQKVACDSKPVLRTAGK